MRGFPALDFDDYPRRMLPARCRSDGAHTAAGLLCGGRVRFVRGEPPTSSAGSRRRALAQDNRNTGHLGPDSGAGEGRCGGT